MGLESGVIFTGAKNEKIIMQISAHETDHGTFLTNGTGRIGSPNFVEKPTFYFIVGGAFDTFHHYQTFLALAKDFEDTIVRTHKGQAINLISAPDLFTTTLQFHSVEATLFNLEAGSES